MATATTSIYEELGVRPVINARGHQTVLGGSTPSPRIKAAMEAAERYFVDMPELLRRSGEIIAQTLGCEAAYVTSGAAAALALGTAACITGDDVEKMARLPHTADLKNQVLIQKTHHYSYERATTIVGTTLVEVGDERGATAAQLEAAIGPRTATILYPAHAEGQPGSIPLREVIEVAHRRSVPVLIDAAGQVFPLARMTSFTAMGADLVCFGAKYIHSPHSSGILCGRRDLVGAAAAQGFIGFETVSNRKGFGRPMKLDRQEIIATTVVLKEWFAMDHDRRLADLERRHEVVARRLAGLPGVSTEHVRAEGAAPRRLRVAIDPARARRAARDVIGALRDGNPAVYVGGDDGSISIYAGTLWEGDEQVVAERLATLLS